MGVLDEFLAGLEGFEWDKGNSDNNWLRHAVRQAETEQAILNRPLLLSPDPEHSRMESRYSVIGRTTAGRRLMVVFTIQENSVRIISARPMNQKERQIYAQAQKQAEGDSEI